METLLAQLEILREMSERWAGLTHKMGNLGNVATAIYDISVKVRATQQSVQRIAFGKGLLARLGNLFIRFGWWLASIGNVKFK